MFELDWYIVVNIETLLLKSVNKFKETYKSIAPLIILYTLLSYLFTPPTLRSLQLKQNFDDLLMQINNQDVLFSILLALIFSLYTIVINQFILINIKRTVFKISRTINALILFFILYIILLLSVLFMVLIIPIPDLILVFFIIMYVSLFFSIYINLDYNKTLIECLVICYILFTKNFKNIFKLILMHGLALVLITYAMVIAGLFVTQIIGNMSIVIINILFYFSSYFLSIVWVYYYLSMDKKFIS